MLRALRRSPVTAALVLVTLFAGVLLTLAHAHALGLPTLPLGLGVACGAGLVLFAEGVRRSREARRAARRSRRGRALLGARGPRRSYDLARDRTTDGQRWLMLARAPPRRSPVSFALPAARRSPATAGGRRPRCGCS